MTILEHSSFRRVLGHFATGVTVVTAPGEHERPVAATANAFASVSLEPPMVLVCLSHRSRTQIAIRNSSQFAIHILTDDQERVARSMARSGPDKVNSIEWRRSPRGNYLLPSYLALLECQLAYDYPGGDHCILVGRVVALDWVEKELTPLVYYSGRMGRLSPLGLSDPVEARRDTLPATTS